MSKINILSQTVYNRIAAGEVVDRPYSAVKELIENSLDAGAKNIEIYIEAGGKELIKVTDDGEGIQKDDLPSAFLPHATSKIKDVGDLDNILTLGFRGEALASISAVSDVEIISVTAGNKAYKITCDGGKIGEVCPAAFEKGTQITVKKLFYNTPVRAKFLKPDKKEEGDITSFVTRYILSHPDVSFKYYTDGALTLQSFGGGLEEAMAQVYGAKTLSQCIRIQAEKDGIKVYGFIGNQNFFKANKSYQSLFLNGRYIVNNTIATAISNAYASYAMKRQFPFYVLNVDVPPDIVDVNVHPNKADVRFIDNRMIFGVVYKIISSVLDGTATAAEFVVSNRIPEIKSTAAPEEERNKIYGMETFDAAPQELIEKYKPDKFDYSPERICTKPPEERIVPEEFDITRELSMVEQCGLWGSEDLPRTVIDDSEEQEVGDDSLVLPSATKKDEQGKIVYETFKICGVIFNTYIIVEKNDEVYFIDQHAAHERLIFDRLMQKVAKRDVKRQPLLLPYVFDVNDDEYRFFENHRRPLLEIGFDILPFGLSSYKVSEVPADLMDIDIKEFIDDLLAEVDSLKDLRIMDILREKLATTACKHAVKGGKVLTQSEVKELISLMKGNMGLKCPHGRPVCVALKKYDIEKMFKRVK